MDARTECLKAAHPRNKLALFTLAFGTFVLGTAELIVVGILNLVAKDTQVSISTAGELVTAYALGIAVIAPILTSVTTRFGRRVVLRIAMIAFLAGNILAAAAVNFDMLLAARVLTGSVGGLFAGVAVVIAAALVEPEHQAGAISMVVGGITVSTVFGVPAGTVIGLALGWRASFIAVLILGAIALVGLLRFVPVVPNRGSGGQAAELRAVLTPRVLALLGVGLLIFGGAFTAFTFLTPFLETETKISGSMISVFLLVFGVAATAGTFVGGRAADRNATLSLLVGNAGMVVALALLYVVGASPALVLVVLAVWGFATFFIVPALMLRVITLAGKGGDLGSTLGISANNLGIAAGSLVGGAIVSAYSAHATVLVAAIVCAVALPATWATRFLHSPAQAPTELPAESTRTADSAPIPS